MEGHCNMHGNFVTVQAFNYMRSESQLSTAVLFFSQCASIIHWVYFTISYTAEYFCPPSDSFQIVVFDIMDTSKSLHEVRCAAHYILG